MSSPTASSPALAVLSSRELFRGITQWMPGWPLALDTFVSQRLQARTQKSRASRRAMTRSTGKPSGPQATSREHMMRALNGRTLPEAIVEELRGHDEQQRAIQLLAMVHDLSRQSAVLRGKSNMSFERTLSHALRHGARAQVIRWLLDMQLHKRSSTQTQTTTHSETTSPTMSQTTPDGHDNDVAYCVSLWCDAIAGFRDDVGSLDVLRDCIPVDVIASEERAQQVRSALGGRRDPALALLRWLRNEWPTLVVPHRVVDVAASQGQQDVVKWLCDDSASERFTQAALQGALDAHHFAMCVYLLRRCRDPEQTMVRHEDGSTSPMLDIAACEGDLALVRALHELAPMVSCTTAAMDAAAANGDLKMVQYLHTKRSEGCTTAAMDNAAANGHLDVVRFLHENRAEGCTAAAVDGAAGNGHRDVVEFLLTNRDEGCTTDAMDRAVENSHLDIVEYLHAMRSEGCTSHAWAHVKSREMVAFLRQHKLQLLTTDGLTNLLMCGMFDEWRDLRSHCKGDGVCGDDEGGDGDSCDGGDGAEQAMVRAGREFKASVIRFLAREMGRVDLEPWAMEGAVETQSVGWLYMIHEICGYGCNFTAVVKAIDADARLPKRTHDLTKQESMLCVLFLAHICKNASVDDAIAYALDRTRSGAASELEASDISTVMATILTLIDPIYRLYEMPDWVLLEFSVHQNTDVRDERRLVDWPQKACQRGDLLALQLLAEAGHSPAFDVGDDNGVAVLDSPHATAIHGNRLEILRWLVENFDSPRLDQLFELAAVGGHVEIAEYLMSRLPSDFRLSRRTRYSFDMSDLTDSALEWIEKTPATSARYDVGCIRDLSVQYGRLDLLRYLRDRDPSQFASDDFSLASIASCHGQSDILKTLMDVPSAFDALSSEDANAAARQGHLAVLQVIRQVRPDLFSQREPLVALLKSSAAFGDPHVLQEVLEAWNSALQVQVDFAVAKDAAEQVPSTASGALQALRLLGLAPFLGVTS